MLLSSLKSQLMIDNVGQIAFPQRENYQFFNINQRTDHHEDLSNTAHPPPHHYICWINTNLHLPQYPPAALHNTNNDVKTYLGLTWLLPLMEHAWLKGNPALLCNNSNGMLWRAASQYQRAPQLPTSTLPLFTRRPGAPSVLQKQIAVDGQMQWCVSCQAAIETFM